ncbi:hypothetical protein N0V94_004101 [Neodidymelliopsis sp. IMI 364377]|nr:hypothetical protein N0V94_004101 [Neodidymelliopsis sp. IMI 364377]
MATAVSDSTGPHNVQTALNYHKPNEDGSPPHPTYVDRPETYDRPVDTHPVIVKDVRGREDQFSLDVNGFEFFKHASAEKDFLDEEQIKNLYYKETEQLLKDA